jgi:hypothetical protein
MLVSPKTAAVKLGVAQLVYMRFAGRDTCRMHVLTKDVVERS